jgi:hypothetical protein
VLAPQIRKIASYEAGSERYRDSGRSADRAASDAAKKVSGVSA